MPARRATQRPPRLNITTYFGRKETSPPKATLPHVTSNSDGQNSDSGLVNPMDKKHDTNIKEAAQQPSKKQRIQIGEQDTQADPISDSDAEHDLQKKTKEVMQQSIEETNAEPRQRLHHNGENKDQEEPRSSPRSSHMESLAERETVQDPQQTKRRWVYIQGCSETELDQAFEDMPDSFLESSEPS